MEMDAKQSKDSYPSAKEKHFPVVEFADFQALIMLLLLPGDEESLDRVRRLLLFRQLRPRGNRLFGLFELGHRRSDGTLWDCSVRGTTGSCCVVVSRSP